MNDPEIKYYFDNGILMGLMEFYLYSKTENMSYEQTKKGWDQAAINNPDAAIHPSGASGKVAYNISGLHDTKDFIDILMGVTNIQCALDFSDKTIIEYGCGNGRMTIPLTDYFEKVYAVDCSYAMLQQLPVKELPEIIPILSNNNNFILPSWLNGDIEQADYALSISVFIHNTFMSGVDILQSIHKNLKSGSLAFLQIPIYDEAKEPASWSDVGVWTQDMLESACKTVGFKIVSMHKNHGKFSFNAIGANHHKLQILQKI